jgi:hypothetical protein
MSRRSANVGSPDQLQISVADVDAPILPAPRRRHLPELVTVVIGVVRGRVVVIVRRRKAERDRAAANVVTATPVTATPGAATRRRHRGTTVWAWHRSIGCPAIAPRRNKASTAAARCCGCRPASAAARCRDRRPATATARCCDSSPAAAAGRPDTGAGDATDTGAAATASCRAAATAGRGTLRADRCGKGSRGQSQRCPDR